MANFIDEKEDAVSATKDDEIEVTEFQTEEVSFEDESKEPDIPASIEETLTLEKEAVDEETSNVSIESNGEAPLGNDTLHSFENVSKTSGGKNVQSLLLQNSDKNSKRKVRHSSRRKERNTLNWSKLVDPSIPTKAKEYHQFPSYFYSGFWIRMFAFLVDLLCITAITSIILNTGLGWLNLTQTGGNFSVYSVLSMIIYLGYFILLTKFTNGQTIGKMVFGIQVICFKEEKLSWSTVLIREGACRFGLQWGILFLGYLAAGFTPKKQHVGDLFSDTSVVTVNYIKAYSGLEY